MINCVPPGHPTEPRNLSVTDIGFNFANLRWQNPSDSGIPPFSMFVLELVSMTPPSPDVNQTFTVTSTDPSFTGNFTVSGLKPNTSYTASVRAVSTSTPLGDLSGPFSSEITFMTVLGGKCVCKLHAWVGLVHFSKPSLPHTTHMHIIEAEFTSATLNNVGGKLNVTWVLRHTGGVPLLNLMVVCTSTEEGDGSGLMQDMICGGGTVCGNGMILLPLGSESVTAGLNYTCTVTAVNQFGATEQQTNAVVATSGQLINGVTFL